MTNTDKCPSLKTSRGRVVSTKYAPRNPYRPAIAQVITDALALDDAVAVPLNEVRCLWEGGSGQRLDRNCMCAECIALTAEQNRNREAALKEKLAATKAELDRCESWDTDGTKAALAKFRAAQLEKEALDEREAQELLLLADRSRPPRWDPLGVAPMLWFLPEPGPAPAPRKRRSERVRDILLAGINGLIALVWEMGKSGRQALRALAVLLAFPFVLLLRVLKAINRFMVRPWPVMVVSWLGIAVGVLDVITGNYLAAGLLFVTSLTYFVSAMYRLAARPRSKPAVEPRRCVRCSVPMEGAGAVCSMCKQAEVVRAEHARAALPNHGVDWTFTKEGWVPSTPRCNCVPGTSKLCTTCRDRQDMVSRTSAASLETASLSPCSSCGDPAVGWMCVRCEAGFNTPKDKMHVSEYQAHLVDESRLVKIGRQGRFDVMAGYNRETMRKWPGRVCAQCGDMISLDNGQCMSPHTRWMGAR
jgi:hypothetical protein